MQYSNRISSDCGSDELPPHMRHLLNKLLVTAVSLGATEARLLNPSLLVVKNGLAAYCNAETCSHYGQSMSCPPHVEGPQMMRKWRDEAQYALVVRIDVPIKELFTGKSRRVMRLLHETVAKVELEAVTFNLGSSRAFAGGSCKQLFCNEFQTCLRLSPSGMCRNPLSARPSMSGFGIDVAAMMESAGWHDVQKPGTATESEMSWVAGLVLLCR